MLWKVAEPFLFGVVGASVRVSKISKSLMFSSLVIVAGGLLVRWLTTYSVTACERGKFTKKERAFIAFSWIPKATVQAALSSTFLILAEEANNDEYKVHG